MNWLNRNKSMAFFCALFVAHGALAAPTVTIITDNPTAFDAFVDDFDLPLLPGTTDYLVTNPAITTFGANWRVTLTTASYFNGAGIADDTVTMKGMLEHIVPPHGEGLGSPIPFNFNAVTNGGAASGVTVTYGPQGGTVPHVSHDDVSEIYLKITSAGVLGGGLNGGLISKWSLTVKAHHTPEPGTGMFCAAVALSALTRRRARR